MNYEDASAEDAAKDYEYQMDLEYEAEQADPLRATCSPNWGPSCDENTDDDLPF